MDAGSLEKANRIFLLFSSLEGFNRIEWDYSILAKNPHLIQFSKQLYSCFVCSTMSKCLSPQTLSAKRHQFSRLPFSSNLGSLFLRTPKNYPRNQKTCLFFLLRNLFFAFFSFLFFFLSLLSIFYI